MSILAKQRNNTLKTILKGNSGSSLIEVAVMLPIFVALIAGAVDYGFAWHIKLELAAAAEAGALYGVQFPTDIVGMQAAAGRDAPDLTGILVNATYGAECFDGTSPVPLSLSPPTCSGNAVSYVQVSTSFSYTPVLPFPGLGSSVGITGRSRMRRTLSQ